MVIIWRRLVVWLRTLLIDIVLKRPIQWSNKLSGVFGIIVDTIKRNEQPTLPKPKIVPDYNIIPRKPIREFFQKLLKR